jgi:uncharacterized protein (TIGR04255 family)
LNEPKYKNPSLIEAVCELRFSPPTKWGMSSFIRFASLAEKEGFANVVDAGEGFQFNFAVGPGKSQAPKVKPVPGRIQTWNSEKTELWQAGPELFAANRRSPYKGWESFRPHILKGFDLYSKTAKPKKASTMVLTYINRIEVDLAKNKPSEFVGFLPDEVDYADQITNFGRHTEQGFKDGDKITVIAGKNMPSDESGFAVILNISYTTPTPKLEVGAFIKNIEKAHTRIIRAFEKSITDLQRKRMEPYD